MPTPASFDYACEQQQQLVQSEASFVNSEFIEPVVGPVMYRVPPSADAGEVNSFSTIPLRRPYEKRRFPVVLQHPTLLDLRRDEYLGAAPLASPEVYSETSSLASFGSESGSSFKQQSGTAGGYRRLVMSGSARMDTIKQSPLNASYSRGFSLLNAGSTHGAELQCVDASSLCEHASAADCGALLKQPLLQEVVVGSSVVEYPSAEVMDQLLVDCSGAEEYEGLQPSDDDQMTNDNAENRNDVVSASPETDVDVEECRVDVESSASILSPRLTASCYDTGAENESPSYDFSQVDLDATHDMDGSSQIALRGVDDDDDDESSSRQSDYGGGGGGQRVYDCLTGHYSSAGRGYPHGFSCAKYYGGDNCEEFNDYSRESPPLASVSPGAIHLNCGEVETSAPQIDVENVRANVDC